MSTEYSDETTKKIEYIPGIECEVTDCVYNDEKRNCYAEKIKVGPMHASSKQDTLCATFEQRPQS